MRLTTEPRRFVKRATAVSAGLVLCATGAVGVHSFADEGEGGGGSSNPPPGEPFIPDTPVDPGDSSAIGRDQLITSSGSTFDETILTKYIPAGGFHSFQGTGLDADLVAFSGNNCVTANSASGGSFTEMKAPIELPDGSRIKRVSFYGADTDATLDIQVEVHREQFTSSPIPPFTVSRTTLQVDAFTTSGSGGSTIVNGADDLEELTGSPSSDGPAVLNFPNRFHSVDVLLFNANPGAHVLCGVRVDYQVAAPADPGTVFHPLDPVRAFDSRQAALAQSGRLGPNETKVIDVSDGYDASGVAIPAQANAVPSNATAVAYNITIAAADGSNFVAVTAGDAASFTASAINYSAGSNVANGSSVAVASDQTIKLWGGDGPGSSHVLIDIVGFYAPPAPPNMAN